MLNGPQETHLGMEASKSQNYVAQVAFFWLSIDDEQGFPIEWLIKSYYGCDMLVEDMLTYKLQCGENTCGIIRIHVNHWKKDKE